MNRGDGETDRRQRFGVLCESLRPDLLRFAFWLGRDRQLAEDVVQEAMLRAMEVVRRAGGRGPGQTLVPDDRAPRVRTQLRAQAVAAPTGAGLPTGVTMTSSGLLYAGTANVGTTTGVVFRYSEPS